MTLIFIVTAILIGLAIGTIFSENVKDFANSIIDVTIALAIRVLHKINRRLDRFTEK